MGYLHIITKDPISPRYTHSNVYVLDDPNGDLKHVDFRVDRIWRSDQVYVGPLKLIRTVGVENGKRVDLLSRELLGLDPKEYDGIAVHILDPDQKTTLAGSRKKNGDALSGYKDAFREEGEDAMVGGFRFKDRTVARLIGKSFEYEAGLFRP
ncbi:MAG: hypothetical protein HYT71_02115 [Candidatus Aenigmarchaeota archaeon]|nr:hypothetical protein [Candidatus Aenigmarchaeota archaeon]